MNLLVDLTQFLTTKFPGVTFIKKVPGLMLIIGKTQNSEQLYKYCTEVDVYGNETFVSLDFYTSNPILVEKYK